ncbi:MAG TPA: hypothetical protein VEQ58_23105, partial [Polyangiaceae bacterium]|nr:hypothetical protein [Polyangiaceae bacterium]
VFSARFVSAALAALIALGALGCGPTVRPYKPSSEAEGGQPDQPTDSKPDPLEPCTTAKDRRCSGVVPQVCSNGFWLNEAACSSACEGAGVCTCQPGARQCSGETPQMCLNGEWQDLQACQPNIQACTNGVCAPFRLRDAGLATLGVPGGGPTSPLRQHSLSINPRVCSAKFCMTGEIR